MENNVWKHQNVGKESKMSIKYIHCLFSGRHAETTVETHLLNKFLDVHPKKFM